MQNYKYFVNKIVKINVMKVIRNSLNRYLSNSTLIYLSNGPGKNLKFTLQFNILI